MADDNPFVLTTGQERVLNAQGIPILRSGQGADDGFFDSVIKSYTNLVNTPVVLFSGFFLLIALIAELDAKDGPLEALKAEIDNAVAMADIPRFEKFLLNFLGSLVKFAINYKFKFIAIAFAWLPYFAKPSSKNMYMSIAFTIMILVFKKWELWDILILTQLYFLFTQVRKPMYKIIFFILGILIFYIGVEFTVLTQLKRAAKQASPILSKNVSTPLPKP